VARNESEPGGQTERHGDGRGARGYRSAGRA
jgi:hypothetical protein